MEGKPPEVLDAQARGDTRALQAMGRAGGRATAKIRAKERREKEAWALLQQEDMLQVALARRDHLLPEDNIPPEILELVEGKLPRRKKKRGAK